MLRTSGKFVESVIIFVGVGGMSIHPRGQTGCVSDSNVSLGRKLSRPLPLVPRQRTFHNLCCICCFTQHSFVVQQIALEIYVVN